MIHPVTLSASHYSDSFTSMDFPEKHLGSVRCGGRKIFYSTAGDEGADATPVLFFYPAGANRRMIQPLHEAALAAHLKVICVNRPGKGGTSRPCHPSREEKHSPDHSSGSLATRHMSTALQDALFVLDQLGIRKVSLLCMCAGAPFAMAFATQHPERTTGLFMGISSWILPADCGWSNTTLLYYTGSRSWMPKRLLVSPLAGSVFYSIGSSMTSLPASWVHGALRNKLSPREQTAFDAKFSDKDEFSKMMLWMNEEKGGAGDDVAVLMSKGKDLGIDYQRMGETHAVLFWHPEKDTMVPYGAAKWAAQHIPSAELRQLAGGSHDGAGFLLYPSIVDSFKWLVPGNQHVC